MIIAEVPERVYSSVHDFCVGLLADYDEELNHLPKHGGTVHISSKQGDEKQEAPNF